MKPFQPNEQQLRAIHNGATKLWIPVSTKIAVTINPIDKEYGECLRYTYVEDGHTSIRRYNEFYKEWASLQPGEQYFVQEDFFRGKGTHSDVVNSIDNELTKKLLGDRVIDSNQMTEKQSHYKFTVTNIEVKSAHQLNLMESILRGMRCYASSYKEWHDSQYPYQPYNTNPYGFLVAIERI